MALARGIDQGFVRQTIVGATVLFANRLRIVLISEGIETREESAALSALGMLMQGYFFALPHLEALPEGAFGGVMSSLYV
ncbi:Diguanylate phosphodiesterase [Pseudomonas savastanoi pv. glycinea]|nr:diguanylate phosphodiesterase [Pseudomonas savastanoi pv. glycinea str. B076]EFW84733.1 diguanylate phosphodiesterase [Pseudomonas savastanoi pv. glycinea str. race 4]KPC28074.1 Diguanylate phosphodiesterase [Pseudomonas savastanoi pv. glycinea]EGH15945.1 diguanylate phosphodiesterase [Pseudomonas savastanoi pv. glycinea str. race 4]KPC31373.1 Diguanylate phosphodiesterase [Pseudomonas savastanoi pv. glycinea]